MIPTDMARDPTASAPARHQRERRDWRIAYDADCGFCRWSLALVLRLDRAACLAPVELGAESTDLLLADLTPEQRAASWHLISPDGDRWSAGAAAPPLLRLLPGGRAPAAVLAAAPRA